MGLSIDFLLRPAAGWCWVTVVATKFINGAVTRTGDGLGIIVTVCSKGFRHGPCCLH